MADESLERRLLTAGIALTDDAVDTWRPLRAVEGTRATMIDLYELAARPRGLRGRDLPAAERYPLARAVMPDIWPDFDTTEGSARTGDVITIADYDPSWPQRYQAWQGKLRAALGPAAVRIDHVGSTSVSALPAKAIIDVQISVNDLTNEDSYVLPGAARSNSEAGTSTTDTSVPTPASDVTSTFTSARPAGTGRSITCVPATSFEPTLRRANGTPR